MMSWLLEEVIEIMKYTYTEKDLDLISWERIDSFIDRFIKM